MTILIAAALAFLVLHLVVAGTRLRDVIVRLIGERPYLALFSLASLAGIAWMAMSFNAASRAGSPVVWDLGPAVTHLGIVVVGFAFLLGVPGLLTPNPTALMQESAAGRGDVVRGVLRITRHPFLWGAALWAAFHVLANGDEASIVFFGTFAVLAVVGTYSIDAKRARAMGSAWTAFAQQTSNIPFAAILTGRNTLKLGELMDYRLVAGIVVFAVIAFAHPWLFSTSAFPGGWSPY